MSAERGGRGEGQSAPWPVPRIGRKDLQDPDRDVMDPGHPVPADEPGGSDCDAGAEGPVQLELPATGTVWRPAEPLRKARSEKASTTYAEIADTLAVSTKKFVPVFTALYESMSDTQKKNADILFRRGAAAKTTTPKGK